MGDKMTEIATVKQSDGMLAVLEKAASDPSCDVNKMQSILDMQERMFDKNAQIAFNKAMVECQKHMPSVVRDKTNQQTGTTYAAFETILHTVRPCYTKYGFSLSFGTDKSPVDGHIRVTCDTMHAEGHTKHDYVDLPIDNVGARGTVNKTAVHGTGSTYSYGKRYLLTMIFNIAIANHDDDAIKSGGVTIQSLLQHICWVRDNFDIVMALKTAISNDDHILTAQCWCDMPENDKSEIWKAPSKGGILTTQELAYLRSKHVSDAVKEVLNG